VRALDVAIVSYSVKRELGVPVATASLCLPAPATAAIWRNLQRKEKK
jgi:hypothetical protein